MAVKIIFLFWIFLNNYSLTECLACNFGMQFFVLAILPLNFIKIWTNRLSWFWEITCFISAANFMVFTVISRIARKKEPILVPIVWILHLINIFFKYFGSYFQILSYQKRFPRYAHISNLIKIGSPVWALEYWSVR